MSERASLFPDSDLIGYVEIVYGQVMADRCADIFELDPENESGFANSIRRSLTNEIARKAAEVE